MCAQIGSVVIVLHAPSDPEVETVDEILAYASQFCELPLRTQSGIQSSMSVHSFSDISRFRGYFLRLHDLPRRTYSWHEEPDDIPLDMFSSRQCIDHGYQGQFLIV